jgi:hypothetical protein
LNKKNDFRLLPNFLTNSVELGVVKIFLANTLLLPAFLTLEKLKTEKTVDASGEEATSLADQK